ncbi:MAG: nucleotidyltransferase family protein [Candidatus Sulfotelmatobacter sp.]
MRAMILAAGLGTRLRPLTNERPKALVEVDGRTLLEITLSRLRGFGVHEVILNVHHFADMVGDYLKAHDNFGMRVEVSREEILLDTGGGLKKAAWFFLEDAGALDDPFILHNVDVVSAIDLGLMVQAHNASQALATLAVQDRETSRYLLFDEKFRLCGRGTGRSDSPHAQALAFSGVHVISPRLLPMMTEGGAFSIIDFYVRLAAQGEKILGFRADQYYWRDLGRPENVAQAAQDFKDKVLS